MKNIITLSDRFFAAPWKEYDTGVQIYRELRRVCDAECDATTKRDIAKRIDRVSALLSAIYEATIGVNPSVVRRGDKLLPRVAWLPASVLDEETGIAYTPTQPTLPTFTSKEERCVYLKQLADACLVPEKKHVAAQSSSAEVVCKSSPRKPRRKRTSNSEA